MNKITYRNIGKSEKIVQYKTKQQVVFAILNIQWWVLSQTDVMLCIYMVFYSFGSPTITHVLLSFSSARIQRNSVH
jgi:hypothetical protein